ncbi:PREDICTED: uncharacterized protein LOC108504079 isoform X2 [Lepidothrix coronata]|uniref:Uncharacterized protein LOC108504079 isoform X2 n=1 Tax=Lepidothrix coronata TaxID=321398 RepID=A0A6J0IE27_9PASS|nr:PREDICTED: uncharacterized protein LOC108504079 isoform X2 [Lepidothrix coronata]
MFWVRPCKLLSHRELPARLSLDGLASPLKLSAPGSLRESLFQQTGPIRSTRLLLERGLEKRDGGEGVSPTPPGPRVPPARRFPANTGARTLPQPLEDQRFVTWRRKPGASNTEIISWIVPDVTEEAGKPQAFFLCQALPWKGLFFAPAQSKERGKELWPEDTLQPRGQEATCRSAS